MLYLIKMYRDTTWKCWKRFKIKADLKLWSHLKLEMQRLFLLNLFVSLDWMMKLCSSWWRTEKSIYFFPSNVPALSSLCRLVTLKVLNSIVLLGQSCVYVKRAKMEDKLFERPPAAPPSSAKSPGKADPARCRTPSGKKKERLKRLRREKKQYSYRNNLRYVMNSYFVKAFVYTHKDP